VPNGPARIGTILWLYVDKLFARPRQPLSRHKAQFLIKRAASRKISGLHLREEKLKIMFSRSLGKISGVVLFCLAVGTTASAQYGSGTTGMPVAPGTTGTGNMAGTPNYSYGNGKAIGIGVGAAAGAAVGIALYMHHRHVKVNEAAQAAQTPKSEASIIGCTQSSLTGVTLKNENDNLTYTILSSGSTKLQSGQRVELQGAVLNQKSGINAFSVHQLVDNYGTCGLSTVVAQKTGDDKSTLAARLN
jgi:hypothetical protein